MDNQIATLLKIIGTEDGSTPGTEGRVELTGVLADALLDETGWTPNQIAQSKGKPVHITRYGRLELWCDGLYIEYRDVRPMVFSALRRAGMTTVAA